jgi:hypothetical protein
MDALCVSTLSSPKEVKPVSLLDEIDALARAGSASVSFLADLVVQHAPQHPGIEGLVGRPGHAVLMEAFMRARITSGSNAVANDDQVPSAPLRRTLHV